MRCLALLSALLAAPSSCSRCHFEPAALQAAKARHAHELLASIERTACFGACPAYKVQVFRDGTVEYDGEYHVQVVGHASGHLDDNELAALDDLFIRKGYLALDSSYESEDATDMPSVFTSYSPGGCMKSVAHYHGDVSAPLVLREIENGIDSIVHAERWVGTKR